MMSGKKTIIFTEFFTFIAGGQIVLINTIKYLKNFYNIEVLLFNPGKIENELKRLKIKYEIIKSPKKVKYRYFFLFIPFWVKLIKYLLKNKKRINLIYVSNYFSAKLIFPFAVFFKIPLIWHKHYIVAKHKNSYLSRQIRFFSKFSQKIICVSDAVKESLIKIGVDSKKLITIHNGIYIPKYNYKKIRHIIRKKYKLEKKFVVGTVGYFRRNKGFDILLKAAHFIKKKNKNIKFLIVGKEENDKRYAEELKDLYHKFKLEDTVFFTGEQDRFKYIPAFDLFALTSINEPFALVVLESMGLGVCVIGFDSGGFKEVVKNNYNGFIIREISYIKFAKKILNIYKNKNKLKKMSKLAEYTIQKNFNVDNYYKKIIKVIEEVI